MDSHDDEVAVTGVVSHSRCFMYYPGDEEWQHRQCDRIGLMYRWPNEVIPGSHATLLTLHNTFHDICGDGNCLFWSFSLIITGSQKQHTLVRAAIVRHMRSLLGRNRIESVLCLRMQSGHREWKSTLWPLKWNKMVYGDQKLMSRH